MEYNPSNIPSDAELTSEEVEDVSTPDKEFLQKVNETTGRNYENMEEALKGLKETYSFVGDETIAKLREKASKFEELSQKEAPKKPQPEYQGMNDRLDRIEFLRKYPEAESVVDVVSSRARDKSVTFEEAYIGSPLRSMVESEAKRLGKKAKPGFIESGQRVSIGGTPVDISREEFKKLPLAEKRKIVSRLPGWNKPIERVEISR